MRPATDGGWEVTVAPFDAAANGAGPGASARSERYDAVLVANGHHWDPRWPEPAFPGEFAGEAIHAHHYRDWQGYEDKNVLVVGLGNSACDIAVETSRVSKMTYLATRRGAWIIPKFTGRMPSDMVGLTLMHRLPLPIAKRIIRAMVQIGQGHPSSFGLPVAYSLRGGDSFLRRGLGLPVP